MDSMRLKSPEKKPIFLSIFASLALCIVIIVAISSTLFYVNIEKTMTDQISLANMKSLDQISYEVNSMAKMASTISYQIYSDVTISKLLNFSNLNINDQSLAINQIENYQFIFPIIDSIYVYNGTSDEFYVRSNNLNGNYGMNKGSFYDKQVVTIIDHHKDYKPLIPIARKFQDANGNSLNLYTFIMYSDIWSSSNAVFVNINESSIQSIIDNEQGGGESFIMDGKGVIVSDSKNYPMLTDVSGNDYVDHILGNSSASGYFVSSVNGVKSLIVYTAPDSIGWTYVRVFRWDVLFSTITKIKTIMIGFSLAILVLGVLSAFIITRQLYRPISKLISNIRSLEAEKKDNTFLMKQELLRKMLLDNVSEAKPILMKKHDELGIKIPFDKPVYVLLLKIDRFKAFMKQYNAEERDTLKNAILRTSSEMLSDCAQSEAVDAGEDALVLILDGSGIEEKETGSILNDRLAAIQTALQDRFKTSVSVAVSTAGRNMETLHELYGQAAKASLHRLFYGQGCIIFAKDIMAYSSKGYSYPLQKEKLLIDSLMENKMDDVKRIYKEIVDETSSYPISVFNLTISHLIFTLNNTFNIITTNNSVSNGLDVGIPVGLLSEMETMEEFNTSIYAILDRLSRSLEEKKTLKHEQIVNSINEIIQSRYAATDLSISSIADALGMSEAYICRIYKQLTLHTILESIVNIRMRKARELLKDTDCSVSLIAEKSGFANSTYFYTAFKAANGVTPSDYRKNIQG